MAVVFLLGFGLASIAAAIDEPFFCIPLLIAGGSLMYWGLS